MPKEIPLNIKKLMMRCLSLSLLVVLSGCGGGGGSDGGQLNQSPTVIKGFYTGTVASTEFVSVVTPDLDWYSLHFRSTASIDIYSGKLNLGVNGSATTTSSGLLAYMNDKPRSGTASLTSATSQTFNGVLNLEAIPGTSAQSLSISLSSHPAVSSDMSGNWIGIWSDGLSKNGPVSFGISTSGSGSASVINCGFSVLLSPISNVNIYTAVITIPAQTGCDRTDNKPNGVVLNGVAVMYASPVAGKIRLDLVAVDSVGSGISFRGDK
jgi:hypothetical protein